MTTNNKPSIESITPDTCGLHGKVLVTITGENLSDIVNVNFGTAGATLVGTPTPSSIEITVPNTDSAGAVTVTLIDKVGNQYPFTGLFTYKLPEVWSVNPASGSLSGGKEITLTGQYLTGTEAVNFGVLGVQASDIAVINDGSVTVKNTAAPHNESVQVEAIVQGKASTKTATFSYSSEDSAPVPMVFNSENPSSTFVQFLGDDNLDGFYHDSNGVKKTLAANTSYSLSQITSSTAISAGVPANLPAVAVVSFSGRVYVNFGMQGLQGLKSGYIPNAAGGVAPNTDPNLDTRYQYFEPTIKSAQMNVDLSYIDFTAISLSLEAKNAPNASNPKQASQSSQSLVDATATTASPADASVLPSSGDLLPNPSFARVISPQLAQTKCYHDFSKYLLSLNGTSTVLAGTYVGTGKQPSSDAKTQAQSYHYVATFDIVQDKKTKVISGAVTLTPKSDSGDGSAPGVPKVQRGTGVGSNTGNITLDFTDLNKQIGIYGCNAPYSLNSGGKTDGITNDIYGQVVGDLFSGLNFGYVGSTQVFGNKQVGELTSTQWWGGVLPDGTVIDTSATPGGQGLYFSGVQTDAEFYNSYAGSLSELTVGYGFPLQDRLGKNLMSMNSDTDQGAYLEVFIEKTPSI